MEHDIEIPPTWNRTEWAREMYRWRKQHEHIVGYSVDDIRLPETISIGDLELRKFQPNPMLKAPSHLLERAKFPVVDVHTHLIDANVEEVIRGMDTLNIEKAVNLTGGVEHHLDETLGKLDRAYPDRFATFSTPDFRKRCGPEFGERAAAQLEADVAKGAKGLKILKVLGLYARDEEGNLLAVDSALFDPLWAKAAELNLPVMLHVGDPPAFFEPPNHANERYVELTNHPEWYYPQDTYPRLETILEQRDNVFKRHPNTSFICAHMANTTHDLARLASMLDTFPNVHVEISAQINELGRQPYTAREFFLKYQDRVLFGTDNIGDALSPPHYRLYFRFLETADEYFPFSPEAEGQGWWRIYGLYLPDEVLKKVYRENAMKLVRFGA